MMQAALLRLDPIEDREEYATLARLLAGGDPQALGSLPESDSPDAPGWACV